MELTCRAMEEPTFAFKAKYSLGWAGLIVPIASLPNHWWLTFWVVARVKFGGNCGMTKSGFWFIGSAVAMEMFEPFEMT